MKVHDLLHEGSVNHSTRHINNSTILQGNTTIINILLNFFFQIPTIKEMFNLKKFRLFLFVLFSFFNNTTDQSQSLQKQKRRNHRLPRNDSLASEQKLFAQVERFPEYTLKVSL